MIKEAHCSEKISKLLKEKGFNEPCTAFWDYELCEYSLYIGGYLTSNSELVDGFSAPTHQMACAWLREKHNIHIGINPMCEKGYFATIYDVADFDHCEIISDTEFFFRVEEVMEVSIKYCLEYLI